MKNKRKIIFKRKLKQIIAGALAIIVCATGLKVGGFAIKADESNAYTTIYLIDNTNESWIANDNATIELVDNSSGHDSYIMTKIDDKIWSVIVPESAYNITFNRLSPDGATQWNSWSAGGRDSNNAYYADGSEYGHWGNYEETEDYFHAGDVVFLDLSEFASWKNDDALMFVNFTTASKAENNNSDVYLAESNSQMYNPMLVYGFVEENIFAYIISEEDEGAEALRFWRGNEDTLWNCSAVLTYEDYRNGNNCVKITGWNDCSTVYNGLYKIDVDKDSDSDELPDYFEPLYSCNVNNADTDNDGLTDGQELLLINSNPTIYDSIITGVSDADADIDGDKLTNIEEINLGTKPDNEDTDYDGLADGQEVNEFLTNPLNTDTDEDALTDFDDVKLGFSPLLKDTDEDGVWDCDETTYQSITTNIEREEQKTVSNVTVSFEGTGYINSSTSIKDIYGIDVHTSEVKGLVGVSIEIISSAEFENATISFELNTDEIDTETAENLLILWYDEDNDTFIPQETYIDLEKMTVETSVTHFSKYMLVDKSEWYEAWRNNINYVSNTETSFDTVIAIDCSGSMSWNDPDFTYTYRDTVFPGSYYDGVVNYRKLASENYISAMSVTDKIAIVLFESNLTIACELTNSRTSAINALSDIYSQGGTNFESAISTSIDVLEISENADKTILLLSDGESTISDATIDEAVANNIKINTVYIGEDGNSTVLENIASSTGGESYIATTAEELIDIYSAINLVQRLDMTDSDGDGLVDIFEISGMKLSNGQIIYTDPFMADTDNDGLLDGEEIKSIPTHKKEIVFDTVGRGEEIWSYVFKMYTNPNKSDTDGDFDKDIIDPNPNVYQLNGRLIEYLDELYNHAVEYQKIKNLAVDEYTIDVEYWFVFMFIRQFNSSYVGGNWNGTGCPIDTDFVEYVKNQNVELYNYFANTKSYYANELGDEGDLYHMAATMTALMFKSGWTYGYKFGLMREYHIDRLAGWAGDLQSAMYDVCIICDDKKELYDTYDEFKVFMKEIIGYDPTKMIKTLEHHEVFNMNDVYADVDADNIYDLLQQDFSIRQAFSTYYEDSIDKRFILFTNSWSKEKIEKTVEIYTNGTYFGVVWPLFNGKKFEEAQSKAARDAFVEFLMEMVENE